MLLKLDYYFESSMKLSVLKWYLLRSMTSLHWFHCICWIYAEIKKEITFIKKRLQHRCFPVKFANFLRTPNLKNICERLLLLLLSLVWTKAIRIALTHFMSLVSFFTPENRETRGFLIFSVAIEREQWHEMSQDGK